MKLKLDENGHVAVSDGKPVYVHDDGKEILFDAPATMQKISGLNAEVKQHREAKGTAEAKLKAFDGIEDAAAALKAGERVSDGLPIYLSTTLPSFLGTAFSARQAQTQTLSCAHSIVSDGYNFDIVHVLYRVCLRRIALHSRLNKVCCR